MLTEVRLKLLEKCQKDALIIGGRGRGVMDNLAGLR